MFHFLATLDGTDAILVEEAVLRAAEPVIGWVPFDIIAGIEDRREMDDVCLTVVIWIGVFTDVAVPVVLFPILDVARWTRVNFDETVERSMLFGLIAFNRCTKAGEATFLATTLLLTLPRLARRLNVDIGGRAKIDRTQK